MRNCSQCGAPIKDDEVVCPVCGKEIQLVPDYETMESRFQEQKKQQALDEELQRQEEERRVREEQEKQELTRRRRKTLAAFLAAAAAVAVICVLLFIPRESDSFEGYMRKAETAYSNSNYEGAMEAVLAALAMDPDSAEALTLKAQIYDKQGEAKKAAEELEQVIADNPNYEAAYSILIRIYNEMGEPHKIRELVENCGNAAIREKYTEYISEEPQFSLEPGTYQEEQSVKITASQGADIYYTTDGSDPTENSTRYTGAVKLKEGNTTLRAIAVNEMGIRSSIAEAEYRISTPAPNRPVIRPVSGSYSAKTVTKITVTADKGCTIYYSFDSRPTTKSTKYTGPVTMKNGTHTFYAIAVNEAGKISGASSATYLLDRSSNASTVATPTPEPTAEPTPEPTPEPTWEPTPEPTWEPTPEPTAEPTPEPTAEPTPEPTPEPTQEPVETPAPEGPDSNESLTE